MDTYLMQPLPEQFRKEDAFYALRHETSCAAGFSSAMFSTSTCVPIDIAVVTHHVYQHRYMIPVPDEEISVSSSPKS